MSEHTDTMDVNDGAREQGATDQDGTVAAGAGATEGPGDDYERATFDELGEGAAGSGAQGETSLDVILDIPVTLSMEIGRSRISIENLLQLAKGSVVELDRMAGEPLDVLVNGTLVARGEVVVVNDKFGVRLSDVISPTERVKSLK
ncbi:MAG: flagellar motor switch protein FliN [Gammaproteobacteria bacterium]